jgi:hypothetical protein
MHKVITKILLAATLASVLSQSVRAQDDYYVLHRAALGGIDSMWVLVEALRSDEQAAGISEQSLQTKLELALRQVGITVVRPHAVSAYLYVAVQVMQVSPGFVFDLLVEVKRLAYVVDSPVQDFGQMVTVWRRSSLGTAGFIGVDAHIYETLQGILEEFQNNFLAANPRR